MSNQVRGILLALITSFLWGLLPILLKHSLIYSPILTTVWVRFTIASLVLIIAFSIQDRTSLKVFKRPPLLGIVTGLALAANYYGYTKGVELTSPANAVVLIQLAPLSFALLGFLVFKEKFGLTQKLGILLTIVGLSLFYNNQIKLLITNLNDYLFGNLFIFVAIATWVLWAFVQKKLSNEWKPQQINLVTYSVAALAFIPLVDWKVFSGFGPLEAAVLLILGLNTVVAYGAFAEALRLIPANQASLIILLCPIFTITAVNGLNYLNESWVGPIQLSLPGYLGVATILTGVMIVVTKKRASERKLETVTND